MSDDNFDGYIDEDEEIQEEMTRVGEIGSGLGTDWGAGEGMEGLVSVSGGNTMGGNSDDGNSSIGMEVELRDQGNQSGSDMAVLVMVGTALMVGTAARTMVMAPMTTAVTVITMVKLAVVRSQHFPKMWV